MNFSAYSESTPNIDARIKLIPWLKPLLFKPLGEIRYSLAVIAFALILLSVTQGSFLLLIGPLFRAIFNSPISGNFSAASLLPGVALQFLPALEQISLSRRDLASILPLAIFSVGVLKAYGGFLYQHHQQILALHLGRRFREQLFAAVLSLPYQQLLMRNAGGWMSIIMNDVSWLQVRVSDLLTGLVRDSFMVIASLAALYAVHWPTALLLNLVSIPIMIGTGRTGKRIAVFAEHWQRELGLMVGAVLDIRKRFEFIRAQSGEDLEKKRFLAINHKYYSFISRSILIRSALAPMVELIGFLLFAAVLFAVGSGLSGFELQASQMLQFFAALGILLRPLKSIGEQFSRFHETLGVLRQSIETFAEVKSHAKVEDSVFDTPDQWQPEKGSLKLSRLEVSYKQGFSLIAEELELAGGKAVALIGPSGAGKSSLIRVLAGLHKPNSWVANVPLNRIAKSATLVSQNPFLFTATIRENLLYGQANAIDDSRLLRELEFIGLQGEFAAMAQTLDSPVDFMQTPLSGGQLQRLTIARALLRPQPLLLMDEVTAAIDPLAEEALTKRLISRCHSEKFCLVFATHRLQQLSYFDEIWFCDSGILQIFSSLDQMLQNERIARFILDSTNLVPNV